MIECNRNSTNEQIFLTEMNRRIASCARRFNSSERSLGNVYLPKGLHARRLVDNLFFLEVKRNLNIRMSIVDFCL